MNIAWQTIILVMLLPFPSKNKIIEIDYRLITVLYYQFPLQLAGMKDAEKAYTLHVGDGRVILALPYIEIEDKPDFLKFK